MFQRRLIGNALAKVHCDPKGRDAMNVVEAIDYLFSEITETIQNVDDAVLKFEWLPWPNAAVPEGR